MAWSWYQRLTLLPLIGAGSSHTSKYDGGKPFYKCTSLLLEYNLVKLLTWDKGLCPPWQKKFTLAITIFHLLLCQVISPHFYCHKTWWTDKKHWICVSEQVSLHTHKMRFSLYLTLMCNLIYTPWLAVLSSLPTTASSPSHFYSPFPCCWHSLSLSSFSIKTGFHHYHLLCSHYQNTDHKTLHFWDWCVKQLLQASLILQEG